MCGYLPEPCPQCSGQVAWFCNSDGPEIVECTSCKLNIESGDAGIKEHEQSQRFWLKLIIGKIEKERENAD